jgi:hypothetical protein
MKGALTPLDKSSRAREIGSPVLFELNVLGSTGGQLTFGNAPANFRYGPQGDSFKSGSAIINWRSSRRL